MLPLVVAAVIIVGGLVLLFTYDSKNNRFTNTSESSYEARTVLTSAGQLHGLEISPDGRSLAFVSAAGEDNVLQVGTVGVEATVPLTRAPGINGPLHWSEDGQSITFSRMIGERTELVEIPFRGGPETVLLTVEGEVLDLDRSNGSLWLVRKSQDGSLTVDVSRTGERELATSFAAAGEEIRWIALAPDGSRIAFSRETSDSADLYLRNLGTGNEQRLTNEGRPIHGIAWAGDSLIYSVGPEAAAKLWMISAEGLKIAELRTPGAAIEPSVSADGSRVLYRRPGTDTLELLEM